MLRRRFLRRYASYHLLFIIPLTRTDIQCFERWGPECDTFDAKRPIYFVMTSLQTFQDYFKDYIVGWIGRHYTPQHADLATEWLDETQIDFLGMSAYLTNNFFPKPNQANALFLKVRLVISYFEEQEVTSS